MLINYFFVVSVFIVSNQNASGSDSPKREKTPGRGKADDRTEKEEDVEDVDRHKADSSHEHVE